MNGTDYFIRYCYDDGSWHDGRFIYDDKPLTEIQQLADDMANSAPQSDGKKIVEVLVFARDKNWKQTLVSTHRRSERGAKETVLQYGNHLASERIRGHFFMDCGGRNPSARMGNVKRAAMQLYNCVNDLCFNHNWTRGFFNDVSHAAVLMERNGNSDGANLVQNTSMMKTFKRWCFVEMDYARYDAKREDERWLRIDVEYGFADCNGGFYVSLWVDSDGDRDEFPEGETPNVTIRVVPAFYDYEGDEKKLMRLMGDEYAPPCFVAKRIGENAKKKNVKKTEKGKD